MTTWYVATNGSDSNNGTGSGTAFLTIQHAASVAQPGDTVLVASGDYPGSFTITCSGTSESPITFRSQTQYGARITVPANNAAHQWGIIVGNSGTDGSVGAYVTLDGFDVDGTTFSSGTQWQGGIQVTGTGDVVQNCKVHDITTGDSNGGAGILMEGWYGGVGMAAQANIVANIGWTSPATKSTVHGIYLSTSGTVQNNLLLKNDITSWHGANHCYFINNTVVGDGTSASNAGILIGSGDVTDSNSGGGHYNTGGNTGSVVFNNVIYKAAVYGIEEEQDTSTGGAVGTNSYGNNLFFQSGTADYLLLGSNAATGTVDGDPLFTNNTGTLAGNYAETKSSPVIGAGLASLGGISAPAADIIGNARPTNGRYDIGAYQVSATGTAGLTVTCLSGTLSMTGASGNGTASVTFSGSNAACQTALNSLSYTAPSTPANDQVYVEFSDGVSGHAPTWTVIPVNVVVTRKPWLQPASNDSAWNTVAGDGQQVSAQSDADTQALINTSGMGLVINYGSQFGVNVLISQSSDPLVAVTYNDDAGNQQTINVHVPSGSDLGGGTDANLFVYDMTQPNKSFAFGQCTLNNGSDLSGGITCGQGEINLTCGVCEDATTGNTGGDVTIGTIREYDLDNGVINHALRWACDASLLKNTGDWATGIAWPQTRADYGEPGYTGSIQPGAWVIIPQSVDVTTLGLTADGLVLAQCLQRFGAGWRDVASQNSFVLYGERVNSAANATKLQNMTNDGPKILPYLRILRNQGPNSKGGGGTPVANVTVPPLDPTTCPATQAPGQVVGVNVSSATQTSLTLSWQAPSTGGAPKNYYVEWRQHGTTAWTQLAATINAPTVTATISGLSVGTSYDVAVYASNDYGFGVPSNTITANTSPSATVLPGSPTGLATTLVKQTSVAYQWTAPSTGSTPMTFQPLYRQSGAAAFNTFGQPTNQTSATITGLSPGTSYDLSVYAINGLGNGPDATALTVSTLVPATTWNQADASPTISLSPDLTTATSSTAVSQSVRSSDSRSSGKLQFDITVNKGSQFTGIGLATADWLLSAADGLGGQVKPGESVGFFPLFNESIYINDALLSSKSGTNDSGTFTASCVVDIDNKGYYVKTPAMVGWNNSTTADPATSTDPISLSTMSAPPWFITFNTRASGDQVVINAAGPFAPGAISGCSPWNSVPVSAAPTTPANFAITGTTVDGSASFSWSASSGSSPINYTVQYQLHAAGSSWQSAPQTTGTTATISGLGNAANTYDFKVIASNSAGSSGASAIITREMPSADRSTCTPGAGQIVDTSGNVWTVSSGGQVIVNGAVDSTTSNVTELAYVSGTIWYKDNSGNWRSKTKPSDSWSGPTTTDPLQSPDRTVITPGNGTITDSAGNVWSINSSNQVVENGTADTGTSNVVKMAYVSGVVWQKNSGGNWYSRSGTGWAGPTTTSPLQSPDKTEVLAGSSSVITDNADNTWGIQVTAGKTPTQGEVTLNGAVDMTSTEITPGNGSFTDSSGNTYSIDSNDNFIENGSAVAGGAGTGAAEYYNGQVYAQDKNTSQWYTWDGSTFTSASAPPTGSQPSTSAIIEIAYVSQQIWAKNTSGQWFSRSGASAAWSQPTKTSPLASSSGSTLTPGGGGSLRDNSDNIWTITSDDYVAANGTKDTTTSGVKEMAFVNGVIWYEDSKNLWRQTTGPGAAWTPSAGQSQSPLSSNSATGSFYVQNGDIIDPNGNVFTAKGINAFTDTPSDATLIPKLFPGTTFVRLAMENWPNMPDPSTFASWVTSLTNKNIVVLIENHPWPQLNALTGSDLTTEGNWYSSLASYFKGNTYVWFASMNEPQGENTAGDISAQHVNTYNAVRNAGSNAIVLFDPLGGGNPGQCGPGPLVAASYANMTNAGWDMHFYGWVMGSATDNTTANDDLLNSAGGTANSGVQGLQQITSGDGTMPVINAEIGAGGWEPQWPAVLQAATVWALQNNYTSGFAVWHWNPGSGDPNDTLTSNDSSLTTYGQQVANAIQNAPTRGGQAPLISAPLSGSVTAGTWEYYNVDQAGLTSGQQFHFAVLRPFGYSTANRYPVLVYEHQNNEGNAWYQNGGDPTQNTIVNQDVINGTFNNTQFRTDHPCIVIVPFCDQTDGTSGSGDNFGGYGDTPGSEANEQGVVAAVRYVWANFSCYQGKTYITGDSLGGIGTIAAMLDYNAVNGPVGKVFTAGFACSGAISRSPDPTQDSGTVTRMKSVPLMCIAGSGDDTASSGADNNYYERPMWTAMTGNSNYPAPVGVQGGSLSGMQAGSGSLYYYGEDTTLGHNTWNSDGNGSTTDAEGGSHCYRFYPTNGKFAYDWLFSQTTPGAS